MTARRLRSAARNRRPAFLSGVAAVVAKTPTGLFDWPTDLDAATAMMALVFAGLTGVFFGWYPAHCAASTDPIDALRCE